MRQAPFLPAMEAMTNTLAYDHSAVMGKEDAVPSDHVTSVTVPALVMSGGARPPFMRATAKTLSEIIPHARLQILDGQIHDVSPAVLAPVLAGFF